MYMITRFNKAKRAEALWYNQYSNSTMWGSITPVSNKTKREIHEGLVALGPFPTPEQVNEIIGNTSWTDCRCDECGKSVDKVIQVGQDPDYESSTAEICVQCLKKAIKLSKEV